MKKILLIWVLFIGSHISYAQYQGEWRAQLATEYGTGTNLFGMGLLSEYFIIDRLSVVPSIMVLLPETGKATNLHVDARYYFNEGTSQLYGLLGFNYYRRRLEFAGENDNLIQSPGLNVGGGYNYRISEEFSLDAQIKFQPQNNNNLVIGVGINYHIN
ncbi:porin family protein [Anditalea andensis]|uniref:Uncharacterized protein n=1 Tax=Anditalea andensis TaxID=1048983 RepID=A0A074KRC6_9BACT|nr:hypothetical protein [Anditalea andensis]KEO72501.1 hypothetical protein EL17_17335 [Anditalea andensis]